MSNRATFADLQAKRGRRYTDTDVPGFGVMRLRSLTPSEYVKIESVQSRAAMAFGQDKKNQGEQLLTQIDELLVRLMWVNDSDAPEVPADAVRPFGDVDMAVFSAILRACKEHAGIDGNGVDDATKNSPGTLGSDSP